MLENITKLMKNQKINIIILDFYWGFYENYLGNYFFYNRHILSCR
ncbi:hypothetical protein J2Y65_000078 [Aeromonas salmonicida]|nr:hypothetical protein [Aeromonas salmonicida]